METNQSKIKMRTTRTDEQIIEAIEEFNKAFASGITVPEFCEAYDISNSTFYEWKKKYTQAMNGTPEKTEPEKTGYQQFTFSAEELMPDRVSVEVELPDGKLFRFFGNVEPTVVKTLIA